MNKTIKVSILIPAYNAEAYIDECLISVRQQTLKEVEIIVADDGSTDATLQHIERHAAIDARIRLLHLPHQGVSPTRNALLEAAKGVYVGILDSDDTVAPDAFEQLYHRAETCHADMVIGSIRYCNEDGTSYRMGDRSHTFPTQTEVYSGKECFCRLIENGEYIPMTYSSLYRRSLIEEHGLHFEGTTHDDEFFTPYAFYAAEQVAYYPGDFYFYRLHDASMMHVTERFRERAASLYLIAGQLGLFIDEQLVEEEVKRAYHSLVDDLQRRSQRVYEQALAVSTRHCLWIISGESTANQYGVGTYVNQLANCFDRDMWDVHVVILYAHQQQNVKWRYENGIATYDIPTPYEFQTGWTKSKEKQYLRNVFYYIASRIPTERAVYCHFNFTNHYELAMLFREKIQAKILFTLHYTEWSFSLLGDRQKMDQILAEPKTQCQKLIVSQFEAEKKFMTDCCDKIIAIARHSYKMLRELYGIPETQIAFIPNGLQDTYVERSHEERDALRAKYGFGKQERLIISAGRLAPVKGVTELVEAFGKICNLFPQFRLIVAGSGNIMGCLEKANPFWSQVTFTGFIPKKQLFELYAIAEFGIVPSIHEEFGYVAIEMMMNKLPVLVHQTTGLREIVADGAFGAMFRFDNMHKVESLQAALEALLSGKYSLGNLEVGRERMLNCYSLEDFQERIGTVYHSVNAL